LANVTFLLATFSAFASFPQTFRGRALIRRATFVGGSSRSRACLELQGEGPLAAATGRVGRLLVASDGGRVLLDEAPVKRRRRRWPHGSRALVPLLTVTFLAIAGYVILRPDGGTIPAATSRELSDAAAQIGRGRTDAYAFLAVDVLGRPARFDPCQPVRYVVNPAEAPEDWPAVLAESLAEVSSATGVTFEDIGITTDETVIPSGVDPASFLNDLGGKPYAALGRPSFQPQRYDADDWAPILIQWANFGRRYAGISYLGVSGNEVRTKADGEQVLLSGTIVSTTKLGRTEQKSVLMHEIAHLLGLGHVDDAGQVMARVHSRPHTSWGAGDRLGLEKVGRQAGCLTTPTPP